MKYRYIVVVVVDDPRECLKQMKFDRELLQSQGISTMINNSGYSLETDSSIISYYHKNNAGTHMRGLIVDKAIIYSTGEWYPTWESECLAPAMSGRGDLIKVY